MAGTKTGAIRSLATKIGIDEAEFRRLVASGQKWCYRCRTWKNKSDFGRDKHRSDGLTSLCVSCRSECAKARYTPKARPPAGRRFVDARAGDKKQARRRIDHLIASGLLPEPDVLPCCDCKHLGDDRRHEYDHYLGYEPEHHEDVEAVCSRCHRKRSIERGEWKRGS